MRKNIITLLLSLTFVYCGLAQQKDSLKTTEVKKDVVQPKVETKKLWYESIQIRGYMQVRYNRLLETNEKLKCDQCDRSIGENGGFFVRRMRIIFSGNVNKRVYFYVQPDFASSASSTSLHFGQIRDMYVDVAFDDKKEYRLRIGQSKVPYGFENMQSSQNRLPLDRNDAINSAVSNERDLGVFFYYAPDKVRQLYASLVADGLKGSGDYGTFAFGAYNGQTANKPEANNNLHVVSRLTYPIKLKNGQIIEPGIQAYTGKYTLTSDLRTANLKSTKSDFTFNDQRIAGTFVMYSKPFGILAEYNVGTGPEFNPVTKQVEQQKLKGGFATLSYLYKSKHQSFQPFFRYMKYSGGKKHEVDARSYDVEDYEIGVEWTPNKNFELVTNYTISDRRFEDLAKPVNHQKGNLLRIQAQLNF
jgi:phosphate-selective porin